MTTMTETESKLYGTYCGDCDRIRKDFYCGKCRGWFIKKLFVSELEKWISLLPDGAIIKVVRVSDDGGRDDESFEGVGLYCQDTDQTYILPCANSRIQKAVFKKAESLSDKELADRYRSLCE
jgi:hypothetical protein